MAWCRLPYRSVWNTRSATSLSARASNAGSSSTFSGLPVPTEVTCVPGPTHEAITSGVVLAVAVTITRWSRTAGSSGEPGERAGAHQQGLVRVLGRQVLERQGDRRGRAEIGEIAVLLEQRGGDTGIGVEQQKHAVARGQTARPVAIEPRGYLEDDVPAAREVRAFDMHFGLLLAQLQHHRVGERGLAAPQRAEAPLDGRDRHAEGDLVPERFERDNPHLSRRTPASDPVRSRRALPGNGAAPPRSRTGCGSANRSDRRVRAGRRARPASSPPGRAR